MQQVVYAISHDLQASARHIRSFVQLLERHLGVELDEEAADYIDRIGVAVDALQARLDALTRLSRVVSRSAEPECCKARDALEEALEILRPTVQNTGATIDIDPLPTVMADRAQLVTVFVELIGNALKFCAEPPHIRVGAELNGPSCALCIADSGPGFRATNCDTAFELFRRFHKVSVPGTGTGLTIVRRVVDLHRGSTTIESTPEGGTSVQFTLPLAGERTKA